MSRAIAFVAVCILLAATANAFGAHVRYAKELRARSGATAPPDPTDPPIPPPHHYTVGTSFGIYMEFVQAINTRNITRLDAVLHADFEAMVSANGCTPLSRATFLADFKRYFTKAGAIMYLPQQVLPTHQMLFAQQEEMYFFSQDAQKPEPTFEGPRFVVVTVDLHKAQVMAYTELKPMKQANSTAMTDVFMQLSNASTNLTYWENAFTDNLEWIPLGPGGQIEAFNKTDLLRGVKQVQKNQVTSMQKTQVLYTTCNFVAAQFVSMTTDIDGSQNILQDYSIFQMNGNGDLKINTWVEFGYQTYFH